MLCNVLEMSVEGENGALLMIYSSFMCVTLFNNGPGKVCERQPLQTICRPHH